MKKVLLFIFLLLLALPVHGLEDYNFIRKYKYYRLNKVLGPMVSKEEINSEYPLIDENIYEKGNLSELSIKKPDEKEERIIYKYNGFHYLKMPKIDSVTIDVRSDSPLYDINIKSTSGDIIYEDRTGMIIDGMSITYNFEKGYELNDLIIEGKGEGNKEKYIFSLLFKSNDKVVSELAVNYFSPDIILYGKTSLLKDNAYEDIFCLSKLDNDNVIYKGEVDLYQYQDYLYQSYKLEKEYYNDYLMGPFEDYIYRDDNDFIDVEKEVNDKTNFSSNENMIFYGKENIDNSKKITHMNNTNPTLFEDDDFNKIDNKESSKDSYKVNKPKKTQYQHVLKIDNNKTKSNQNDNIYSYFIIVILIIILILMLKLKNKLKENFRWWI